MRLFDTDVKTLLKTMFIFGESPRTASKSIQSACLPGTGFTNISTIFLYFFYLFSIFFLNRF
jgi:hypothetical protein